MGHANDMPFQEQYKFKRWNEILVHENTLANKERKIKGKITTDYWAIIKKFQQRMQSGWERLN